MTKYFFITLAFMCGCASQSTRQAIDKVPTLRRDVEALNLAVDLQDMFGDSVWPGFSKFRTSVVYFTNQDQYLLNPKGSVPSEYVETDMQGLSWSPKIYRATGWYAPDGSSLSKEEIETAYLANAFSSEQANRHFSYSVFFLDSIDRFHKKGMRWSVDDWVAIFWHEVFHNFQDELYSQELISGQITNFSNIQKNVESESFLDQVRKEQRFIMDALKTQQQKVKQELVCRDFIRTRTQRYNRMAKEAVATEKFYETSEGTARYVEELMSIQAGKAFASTGMREKYQISGFESFAKYAARDQARYYGKLDEMSPSMRYFYNTGFGLALLLDQISPEWKATAFQTPGFLYAKVEEWCKVQRK